MNILRFDCTFVSISLSLFLFHMKSIRCNIFPVLIVFDFFCGFWKHNATWDKRYNKICDFTFSRFLRFFFLFIFLFLILWRANWKECIEVMKNKYKFYWNNEKSRWHNRSIRIEWECRVFFVIFFQIKFLLFLDPLKVWNAFKDFNWNILCWQCEFLFSSFSFFIFRFTSFPWCRQNIFVFCSLFILLAQSIDFIYFCDCVHNWSQCLKKKKLYFVHIQLAIE